MATAILVTVGAPVPTRAQEATPLASSRPALYASPQGVSATLPTGTPGGVSVVAHSGVLGRGDRVIAIVRNGTDQPVLGLTVSVSVRDMSRNVIASGASSLTAPVVLPPGGLALVRVPLGGTATPGLAVDVTVAVTDPDPARMDLAIPFLEIADGTLTGAVTAIDADAAYDPELLVVCLGDDGAITDYAFAPLQPTRIDPYRTIPVRLAMPAGCNRFLAAATAHR